MSSAEVAPLPAMEDLRAVFTSVARRHQAMLKQTHEAAVVAPPPTFRYAFSSLRCAWDHQRSLEQMMFGAAPFLPVWAGLTWVRAALESSIVALWLLISPDPQEQVKRGLQYCWEQRKQIHLREEVLQPSPSQKVADDKLAKLKNDFLNEVQAQGFVLDKIDIPSRIAMCGQVWRSESEAQDRRRVIADWRALSGVTHGLAGSLLEVAEISMSSEKINASTQSLIKANSELFKELSHRCCIVQLAAIELFMTRVSQLRPPNRDDS